MYLCHGTCQSQQKSTALTGTRDLEGCYKYSAFQQFLPAFPAVIPTCFSINKKNGITQYEKMSLADHV